jgi:MFS family permease
MVAGLLILAGGIALFARLPADGGGYLSSFLPASLVAALGMSLTFVPAMIAAIGAAPPEQGGLASGMFNTTYQVGSALGLAALTALSITYGAEHVGNPHALTHGFHAAFLGGAGIALAAAFAALTLIRTPRTAAVSAADESQHNEEAKLAA